MDKPSLTLRPDRPVTPRLKPLKVDVRVKLETQLNELEDMIRYYDKREDFHARATLQVAKTNVLLGLQKYE